MTKTDFNKRLTELNQFMSVNDAPMERVNNWLGEQIPNVFTYGAMSERCMEHQLEDLKGCKRQTTFMSDLSVGEWCEGRRGVIDTCKNAMKSWKDDEKYMAEFVLCVNWKAWEHHARGNKEWTKFYSVLYDFIRDLVYDYYEDNPDKTAYVFNYLD